MRSVNTLVIQLTAKLGALQAMTCGSPFIYLRRRKAMRLSKTLLLGVLVLSTSLAFAGKPAKPAGQITEFEAADVTFGGDATEAVQSDGRGSYETFVDGFEAYSEYSRTEVMGGNCEFHLKLGTFVSGDASVDPSGPISEVTMYHSVVNHITSDTEASFPSPGTTVVSNAENPQSLYFIFTAADGGQYAIEAWDDTGEVSLSGHDLDGDGKNDARSIHVSQSKVWKLWAITTETVEVVVGKGKNQRIETEERTTSELVAEYTEMPLNMSFDLLGFRVKQFSLR